MSVADIYETMAYGPAPEDAGFVRDWLKAHDDGFDLFIGGAWVKAHGSEVIATNNPADGSSLGKFPAGDETDVDRAVKAAAEAFPKWSKTSGHGRAKVLYALARLVQKNSRFLAVLETLDNGKPIRETRDIDIPLVARHFYHHAGWAQLMGSELPDREALGVVAQIIPWNFPLLMLAWKIAPAIAAGNTVVLKPAEYTSLTALYFAQLCQEAGVPDGVVNIVTGAGKTGGFIVNHPDIAKIAFTGSTQVGRLIREQTAGSGKKLTLELGGKSPFMVYGDADLDGAVEGLVDAIWFNQGEVCCAGSRLLVEETIADEFIARVKRRLSTFRIGDPLDKAIDMGAVVDPVQRERISALVEAGVAEGATKWQPDVSVPEQGCFYPPTLLLDVAPGHSVVQDEIFGPVLVVMTFRTESEALALANNTRFGLAASIWSENINRAVDAAAKVKAGVVWVNTTNQFDAAAAFGGYRESGFGREGAKHGLYEYTRARKSWADDGAADAAVVAEPAVLESGAADDIDRTAKFYIGGKQARPDNGRTRNVLSASGGVIGRVGEGSRKDIRNAVEAAVKCDAWSKATGHGRAQVLYFIAENLSYRMDEFVERARSQTGVGKVAAKRQVDLSISRLFTWAAWADKYDGCVHGTPFKGVTWSVHEPVGVVGIVCPDTAPLLSFISLMAPVLAMGNRSIIIPSERYPLLAADFCQIFETSDVPAGAINLVTGDRDVLAKVLAEHDGVDALWYHGSRAGSQRVEAASTGNLKQTWVNDGKVLDWLSAPGESRSFLRHATQVKTVWLPHGV
jgi:aldehyde dehydrogenase (NAD+)